ncbi:hypothetical protein JOC54_000993 [Alkalihalobacillus xiaoxiensis]|uniref:DUF2269 family protein n=1 Tax=Shouchella xiaoxiensis TaxID=766895 RepID=A0ABS2SU24_9BACI|nr:hypothetical protein [Shouchella xiaoxiensis]MBM7837762.1 hypothetical protein [Shouchella xiaoxiensis]
MSGIVWFALHMFSSLFLFLCIPLPFLFYAARLDEGERLRRILLNAYRFIFMGAHLALVLLIATGIGLVNDWSDPWIWLVLVITVAIGSSLGFSAKSVRLLRENFANKEAQTQLRYASLVLCASIIAMFAVKYGVYFID